MAKSKPLSELKNKVSSSVLNAAKDKADDLLLDIRLSELREITNMSQVQMAKAMGVTQPTVASMEKIGKNIKLASLKKYIEATGCKLRLDVELPDGNHYGFPI